jgi:hypothetical protein
MVVGQIAQERGCTAIARTIYTDIIQIYEGSDYAALRQRAQIGVDDLRGLR